MPITRFKRNHCEINVSNRTRLCGTYIKIKNRGVFVTPSFSLVCNSPRSQLFISLIEYLTSLIIAQMGIITIKFKIGQTQTPCIKRIN